MAITLSSAYLEEMRKASPEPIVQVAIQTSVPSTKAIYFHNGHNGVDSTIEGDPILQSVTAVTQEYDPLERDLQVGTLQVEVIDNDYTRDLMSNFSFYDADCLVYLLGPEVITTDAALIFRGRVESVRAEEGSIIFDITEYQSKLTNYKSLRTYVNDHPLEVLDQALQDVGIASAKIDSTTFSPGNFTDISHYCFSSYGVNAYLSDSEQTNLPKEPSEGDILYDVYSAEHAGFGVARILPDRFLKEFQQLTQSIMLVDSSGKLKISKLDPSAAVTHHFTVDEYHTFEQDPKPAIYNVISIALGMGANENKLTLKDATSITNYGERVAEINSVYLSPGTLAKPNVLFNGNGITPNGEGTAGFAGTRNLVPGQVAADKISADRPFYALFRREIIKSTAEAALAVAVMPLENYDEDGDLSAYVDVAWGVDYDPIVSRPFGGTQDAPGAGLPFMFSDITAAYNFATAALTRYSNGAPKITFSVGLEFINIELGDMISIDNDFFVSPELRLNALDSTVKFEVVGREILPVGDTVGVKLTCVYVTKSSAPATSVSIVTPPMMKDRLGRSSVDKSAVVKGYMDHSVLDGLDAEATSGLGYKINAGNLSTGAGTRQSGLALTQTATASKHTYIGIDSRSGQLIKQEVATSADEPALAGEEIRLAKVISDGSGVTSVVDLRRIGAITAAQFNRELLAPADGILWNGGFEDWADPGDAPAAWVNTGDGVPVTDFARETSVVHSGGVSLKMKNTGESLVFFSGFIPIDSSQPYRASLWLRQTGNVTMRSDVFWYTSAKVAASTSSASITNAANSANNVWENRSTILTPGSDVAYAKIKLTRPLSPGHDVYFDDVSLKPERPSFSVYGAATTAPGTKSVFQVKYNNENHDYGGNYDHSGSDYDFEAPSAGTYEFSAAVQGVYVGAFTYLTLMIYKNGSVLRESYGGARTVGTKEAFATVETGPVELAKGDLITVQMHPEIQTSFTLNTGASETYFSGRKIS